MKTISTPNAPAAVGPYAQGNIVNGLLFASGQIALVPETGELAGDTIEAQSRQVMKNVGALLEAAGTDSQGKGHSACRRLRACGGREHRAAWPEWRRQVDLHPAAHS